MLYVRPLDYARDDRAKPLKKKSVLSVSSADE